MSEFTKTEKQLIFALGGIAFFVFNLMLLKVLLDKRTNLINENLAYSTRLSEAKTLTSNKELWIGRLKWLQTHTPTYGNDSTSKMMDSLQESLKNSKLSIIHQQLLEPSSKNDLTEISIQFTLEGNLEDMIKWLAKAQKPRELQYLRRLSMKPEEKSGKMTADFVVASVGKELK